MCDSALDVSRFRKYWQRFLRIMQRCGSNMEAGISASRNTQDRKEKTGVSVSLLQLTQPLFDGHCSGSFAKGLSTVYEKPRIRLAFDTGSWVPLGTFEQYHSVYSLCGSASVVVVCEDILRECGSFLVVEHWRDIEIHERIPHTEIAI